VSRGEHENGGLAKACGEEGIPRATFFRLKKQLSYQGGVKKAEVDGTWMQNS
jgi:hypothetical protein